MREFILHERVLNDDFIQIADDGKIFKGGYKAIITYYTYQNHWNDNKHIKRFRTLENAFKWINKQERYNDLDLNDIY